MYKESEAIMDQYIESVDEGVIITSRECTHLVPRAHMDSYFSRKVAKGLLLRLARGVFCKPRKDQPDQLPSIEEIARAKSAWFNRPTVNSPTTELESNKSHDKPLHLDTTSGSSSFKCYNNRTVVTKRVSARKFQLALTSEGQKFRQVWQAKPIRVLVELKKIIRPILNIASEVVTKLYSLIPAWITDVLRKYIPPILCKIEMPNVDSFIKPP